MCSFLECLSSELVICGKHVEGNVVLSVLGQDVVICSPVDGWQHHQACHLLDHLFPAEHPSAFVHLHTCPAFPEAVYVCTYVCLCVSMCPYICVSSCQCPCVYVNMYMCVCVYVCLGSYPSIHSDLGCSVSTYLEQRNICSCFSVYVLMWVIRCEVI